VPLLTVTPVRRVRADAPTAGHRPVVRCLDGADAEATAFELPPEGVLPTGADAERGANLLPPDLR
jgi:hypothetical protein